MRVLVLLHGWSAALTIASVIHLLVLVPKRRIAPRGAALGFLICLSALYILGWVTYPVFRQDIRFGLLRDPATQWLANIFDVKEFLSVGALFLGIAVGTDFLRRRPLTDDNKKAAMIALWFVLAVLVTNSVVGLVLSAVKFF